MQVSRRTTMLAVGILLLSTLLGGCSGAGGGSEPTATFGPAVKTRLAESQRPRPTSTPTPEAAAQVASPSPTIHQETPTPQPATPPTGAPESDPVVEALFLALLSVDDFPEGWQGGEVIVDGQYSQGMTGDDGVFVQPGQGQEDECGYDYNDPRLNQVSSYFDQSVEELLIMHQVALYPNDQSAELLLNQVFAAVARCPEFEETYADGTLSITRFDMVESPAVGEQSGTFKITSSDDEYDYAIVVTGFRVGSVVSFLFQFGSQSMSGPIENWQFNPLATLAADRINMLRETFDALETAPVNVV